MTRDDEARWVFDRVSLLTHALTGPVAPEQERLVTECGRSFRAEGTPTFPVPPILLICPSCLTDSLTGPPPPASLPVPTHY